MDPPPGSNQSGTACFGEAALTNRGPRNPGWLRTFGNLKTVGPPPWDGFSSSGFAEFRVKPNGGGLLIDHSQEMNASVNFSGLPGRGIPKEGPPTDNWCAGGEGKGWRYPFASTVLPDGSYLAASTVCFGPTRTTWDPSVSARSLVAWRSIDSRSYKYVGTIVDASQVVPHHSTAGPTQEVDLAMMADGHTVMIVIRMDGDCTCAMATGANDCGIYRPYYASYSSDSGSTWSRVEAIPGTGCARPRLLSLGPGAPLIMSGGRLCIESMTGLFLWINPSGQRGDDWERYSISCECLPCTPLLASCL